MSWPPSRQRCRSCACSSAACMLYISPLARLLRMSWLAAASLPWCATPGQRCTSTSRSGGPPCLTQCLQPWRSSHGLPVHAQWLTLSSACPPVWRVAPARHSFVPTASGTLAPTSIGERLELGITLLCAPCSLLSQVAVAASVPVSSVAMRRQDARSVLTAASVSFAAGEGGLEAAVRFVHALNGSSTPLLLEPPLALQNGSTGSVSIAKIGALGVRLLLLGHAPIYQGIAPLPAATCSGFIIESFTQFACRLRWLASKVCLVLPMCH